MNADHVGINCAEVKELLSAYYDGELPEAQRAGMARHLESCKACVETLVTFQQLSAIFAAPLTNVKPPPWEEVAAKLQLNKSVQPAQQFHSVDLFQWVRDVASQHKDREVLEGAVASSEHGSRTERPSGEAQSSHSCVEQVPALIRTRLHTLGPTLFPRAGVAPGAWEFGLLNELPGPEAESIIDTIAERAYEKLLPILPIEDLVIVCFGQPMHRCGKRLGRTIAEQRGTGVHVVVADDHFNPTLWCDPSELKDRVVIVFVDVVRTGRLIEQICALCREAQPLQVFGLAMIDQAHHEEAQTPRYALWTEARKERIPLERFEATESRAVVARLRYFDPESGRATAPLPAEVATAQAARATVEECLQALQPVLPFIKESGALQPDTEIQGIRYPWVIQDLHLLRHPHAGPELVRRAAVCLRTLESAGPWALVYPAERFRRAGEWAKSLQAELGWPIIEVGRRKQKHYRGLTEEQRAQLRIQRRAVVVDAVLRTGTTLRSLAHLLRSPGDPVVSDLVAFYVFDGSFRETRETLDQELGVPIHSLFRVPLGRPTEAVGTCWRQRLETTLGEIKRVQFNETQPAWVPVLHQYCERKLKKRRYRPMPPLDHNAETDLRHALDEGEGGERVRLKRARERAMVGIVKGLDVAYAVREPRTRHTLHGYVCNSMPPNFVEACALALATQDDYAWLDPDWLVLHRDLFTDRWSQHWQFLACIAYWIKQQGDREVVSRVCAALREFRCHLEPGSLFPEPMLEERCSLLLGVFS